MEMEFKNIDELVIQKYQEDEQIMIQLFAAWCVNHELNPIEIYARAYPDQQINPALQKVLNEMDETERIEIENETMLDVLQLFGNDDLAFVVTDEIARIAKNKI